MNSPEQLHHALTADLEDTVWLDTALETVTRQPEAIGRLFPAAGRRCGRWALSTADGWTAEDAARVLLLSRLPTDGLAAELDTLYRYGDGAEKRAVLRALSLFGPAVGDAAVPLLHDALRTNDPRLVAAALGPYARHLDPPAWRQAVLKCVFMGIPLARVADLAERADPELAIMLAGLAQERVAAGRAMPDDATALLARIVGETVS